MHCGVALQALCAACGEPLPGDARFCPRCGASTDEAPETREGMLKVATVLFLDVVGSTAHAEGRHPEEVRFSMARFFELMSAEIKREGGLIEKFIGDAVMAVFGVPQTHEDDPARAVRAARAMLSRLAEENNRRDAAETMQVRIAINTGDVLAGGRMGEDLLVTGDPVNVASRLEKAAPPGGILVGERTARAVRHLFELEPVAPLALKGKAQPVSAFLVTGERVAPADDMRLLAPLVGRNGEIDMIEVVLQRVRSSNTGHVVNLVGDAGVGKSRLAQEIAQLLATNTKLMVGRCLPYGDGVTLWPLGEILSAEAGILRTDPPNLAAEKIAKLVREHFPEGETGHDQDVAALAATLGLEVDGGAGEDPRRVYRTLVHAWRALLTSLARERSLLVVVEDLHWADPTMIEVLTELANGVAGPILFLCTSRPDFQRTNPAFGGALRNYLVLPLEPLSRSEARQLAFGLLGSTELPPPVMEEVLERSEGNPFFLEEMIRLLLEEGSNIDLPDNVQTLILARLDSLEAPERRVLQHAAVVGRSFWPGAIARPAGVEDAYEVLRSLEARRLVTERLGSSMSGQPEFSFKHILIRDVAYQSLPRASRAGTHTAVAEWLVSQSGDRSNEIAELLSYHYREAFTITNDETLRVKARAASLTASRSALRRFAIKQAGTLGNSAVDLSNPGAERVEALEAVGDLHNPHDGDSAWAAYLEALTELGPSGDTKGIARLAAKASVVPTRWRGQMQQAPSKQEIDRVLALGLSAAGPGDLREMALLQSSKAWAQIQGYSERDNEGWEAARYALRVAEELDDADLMSSALDAAALWKLTQSEFGEMERVVERRLSLVPRLLDVAEICDAYAVGAWSATFIGDYHKGVGRATQCIDRARGVDAGNYLHGLVWRISSAFMTGEWDDVLADQEEVERLVSEDSRELPPPYVIRPYGYAMFCKQLRGDMQGADRYLEIMRSFHSQPDMPVNLIGSRAIMARALAHRGLAEEARSLLRLEPNQFFGIHLEAFCDVAADQEDWVAASEWVPVARAEAAGSGMKALSYFVDRLEGRMLAATGEHERACGPLESSVSGFDALGAPWESAFSRLHLASALLGAGSRDEARRHLEESREAFAALGSVQEIQRADELLSDYL